MLTSAWANRRAPLVTGLRPPEPMARPDYDGGKRGLAARDAGVLEDEGWNGP